MFDPIMEFIKELDDARVELEEVEECGCLEERMDAAQKVSDLEGRLEMMRLQEASN